MLTTREVTITEHLDAIWPLLEAHREELATHKDIMPLEPRVDVYETMEAQGVLLSIVLEDEGQIVGYSVNFVLTNLHYGTCLMCQNDVLFLAPEYRKGTHGLKLITATVAAAKERGAHIVAWHAKPGTALNKILPRLGYGVQDIMYTRRL